MASSFFKPSGSAPPWPGICKSKPFKPPKKAAFPPDKITVVLNLNWTDPLEGPGNWLGSVQALAGGTGAPTWQGSFTAPGVNINLTFETGAVGQQPRCNVRATIQPASQPLNYVGSSLNSTSLVPFTSGPVTIDGPGIEDPSTAAAFG